jgi:hypothetical protein
MAASSAQAARSSGLAPSAAKCSAMALPIPFDAPLMTTFMAMIFSFHRNLIVNSATKLYGPCIKREILLFAKLHRTRRDALYFNSAQIL